LHGGAARLAVDQKARARIGKAFQRLDQRDGLVPLALRDRQQARFRRRAGMGVDRPAIGDDEARGRQGFQPEVIDARSDSAGDLRVE